MESNRESRSEETKKMILRAARELFSKKGYDAVTMREIAKKAGCSHTTIYLYFKDKETLLHELSMPSLKALQQNLKEIAGMASLSAEERLKEISQTYLHFCLSNRNMYEIFINAKATRVDEESTELEINRIRIELFNLLKQVLQECLSIPKSEQLLAFSRIFYYNLNGILNTYSYPHETLETLLGRLRPTFDMAVEILILGFKEKIKQGGDGR